MDKIRGFFNFKQVRKFFKKGASRVSVLPLVFAAGEFIMPLLLGISVGWFGTVFIDYSISPRNAELRLSVAANIAAAQSSVDPGNGLADFLSANPFSVSPFPVAAGAEIQSEVDRIELKNSFAAADLIGTFPGLGVWLRDDANGLNFIPVGESFDTYELTEVLYDRAIFHDEENNNVTKFLYLFNENASNQAVATPRTRTPRRTPPVHQPAAENQVTAAEAGGREGVVSRETVNDLLMNPFDEMKKFRLRPKFEGNESLGIEVQWIQDDSILGQLGVTQNDVIKSVNGIPMKNMGDVANAINSLMNGSRFDVEVIRENAPIELTYVVR